MTATTYSGSTLWALGQLFACRTSDYRTIHNRPAVAGEIETLIRAGLIERFGTKAVRITKAGRLELSR